MAEAACEHSDRVIFTSDNPRSEDPVAIINDMEEGLPPAAKRKYISIADRKEAIKTAISISKPEDIVLIAGKGHEKYQEIKGVKYDFDDKAIVREMFEVLGK
jgi:UDP-N-acetylmuramoyl-L-alanyl-D-glutamate--2,6-diaminopimelate ligase